MKCVFHCIFGALTLFQPGEAESFTIFENHVYVMAKVNWRIMYTLAPNFEANVYINPKLQTWRLMCTLFPNLEAKVNFNFQLRSRLGLV